MNSPVSTAATTFGLLQLGQRLKLMGMAGAKAKPDRIGQK
jgi:hypothetical protein